MQKNTTRRNVLKGAGIVAAYAGLGLGMPNVVRANDKVVRYLGTATTMGSEIDKKLFEDTGIKVQYIPVTTDEVTKRVLTQPNSLTLWIPNTLVSKTSSIREYPRYGLKAYQKF